MDGHVSEACRFLERMLYLRAFHPREHENLVELLGGQFGNTIIARHGTRYDQGFARASGSPETSANNTLLNKFVAFLAWRMTKVNGQFVPPGQAYRRKGIYGGDDGITADLPFPSFERSAKAMGFSVTASIIKRGDLGVEFLARMYGPDVWSGDPNSCCDIKRAIVKFHSTVYLPPDISPLEKLQEKCRSTVLSDADTPIIGDLASVVSLKLGTHFNTRVAQIRKWNSELDKELQYMNCSAKWMWDIVERDLPGFDVEVFNEWLDYDGDDNTHWLNPPCCLELQAKIKAGPVVINGLVEDADKDSSAVKPTRNARRAKAWRGKRGKA